MYFSNKDQGRNQDCWSVLEDGVTISDGCEEHPFNAENVVTEEREVIDFDHQVNKVENYSQFEIASLLQFDRIDTRILLKDQRNYLILQSTVCLWLELIVNWQ